MKTSAFFLICAVEIFASTTVSNPKEEKEKILNRQKRFLIFTNGGTLKFVTGYLGPIDIPPWQNINCMRNLQFQYGVPPNLTKPTAFTDWQYVGNKGEGARSFSSESSFQKFKPDSSRKIAYEIVEQTLWREGKNGHECMLRAICEVAETPVNHNGLVGEFVQLFFTPGEHENIHQDYRDARKAGLNRVNCEKLYEHCPIGHGILDSFSLVKEFKLENWFNF